MRGPKAETQKRNLCGFGTIPGGFGLHKTTRSFRPLVTDIIPLGYIPRSFGGKLNKENFTLCVRKHQGTNCLEKIPGGELDHSWAKLFGTSTVCFPGACRAQLRGYPA